MNHKHILAYILFTGLSIAHAHCDRTILSGHSLAPYTHAKFSPDGTMIAAISTNGRVMIWDAYYTSDTPVILEHKDPISAFAFASSAREPNTSYIAMASEEGDIEIGKLDGTTRKFHSIKATNQRPDCVPTSMTFSAKVFEVDDDIKLHIAYDDKKVYCYHMHDEPQCDIEFRPILNIQCTPSGEFLYITTNDSILQKVTNDFNREGGDYVKSLKNISCSDFSNINENKFVVVTSDGTVRVGEFNKKDWLNIFNLKAISAQFSPVDDNILLIAHRGEKEDAIYLINPGYNNNKPYHVIDDLEEFRGRLTSVRFNHNGTKVIATLHAGEVIIWDIPQSVRQTLNNLAGDMGKNCIVQ